MILVSKREHRENRATLIFVLEQLGLLPLS